MATSRMLTAARAIRALLLLLIVGSHFAVSYSQIAIVTGNEAFLRGTPADTGAVVDTLVPNSKVQMITRTGDWFLVQSYPFVGWLHRNSLRAESSSESRTGPRTEPIAAAVKSTEVAPSKQTKTSVSPSSEEQRVYFKGPRGGCYYTRPDGKKIYVSHDLCE